MNKVKWVDELAAGRVFEMKTQSRRYPPPLVLVTGEPDRYGNVDTVLIREGGMMKRHDWHPTMRRMPRGTSDFTSRRVARRRRDLERYDLMDLELIRYGRAIDFNGHIETDATRTMLPSIPGVTWSIFWTKSYSYVYPTGWKHELRAAMRGCWHMDSWAGGDWRFGRDSTMHAWLTVETDRRKLAKIERLLRHVHSHLERTEVQMVEYIDQGAGSILPVGNSGPAVKKGGITVHWPNGAWSCHFRSGD